jgi:hypothetical protein
MMGQTSSESEVELKRLKACVGIVLERLPLEKAKEDSLNPTFRRCFQNLKDAAEQNALRLQSTCRGFANRRTLHIRYCEMLTQRRLTIIQSRLRGVSASKLRRLLFLMRIQRYSRAVRTRLELTNWSANQIRSLTAIQQWLRFRTASQNYDRRRESRHLARVSLVVRAFSTFHLSHRAMEQRTMRSLRTVTRFAVSAASMLKTRRAFVLKLFTELSTQVQSMLRCRRSEIMVVERLDALAGAKLMQRQNSILLLSSVLRHRRSAKLSLLMNLRKSLAQTQAILQYRSSTTLVQLRRVRYELQLLHSVFCGYRTRLRAWRARIKFLRARRIHQMMALIQKCARAELSARIRSGKARVAAGLYLQRSCRIVLAHLQLEKIKEKRRRFFRWFRDTDAMEGQRREFSKVIGFEEPVCLKSIIQEQQHPQAYPPPATKPLPAETEGQDLQAVSPGSASTGSFGQPRSRSSSFSREPSISPESSVALTGTFGEASPTPSQWWEKESGASRFTLRFLLGGRQRSAERFHERGAQEPSSRQQLPVARSVQKSQPLPNEPASTMVARELNFSSECLQPPPAARLSMAGGRIRFLQNLAQHQ